MRLAKVWIAYDRTANLGNFNSVKVQFGVSAEIEPGEDPSAIMKGLWAMAKNNVKAQLVPLLKTDKDTAAQMEELFLGLKIEQSAEEVQSALVDRFTNKDTPISWVNGEPPSDWTGDAETASSDGITAGFVPAEK